MPVLSNWFDKRVVQVPYKENCPPVPEGANDPLSEAFKEIDSFCTEHEVEIRQCAFQQKQAVTVIQGNRVEIYLVLSEDTSRPNMFDKICERILYKQIFSAANTTIEVRDKLFKKENSQAKIGLSEMNPGLRYTFRSHSLIVSYGDVKSQLWHLDVTEPNVQFVMAVSTNGVYSTEAARFTDGRALDTFDKIEEMAKSDHLRTDSIIKLWKDDQDCRDLIETFGNLLRLDESDEALERIPASKMNRGDVMCMFGSLIHRGLASFKTRIAWFCDGTPVTQPKTTPYDRDVQLTAATLACELSNLIWRKCNTDDDRCILAAFCTPY